MLRRQEGRGHRRLRRQQPQFGANMGDQERGCREYSGAGGTCLSASHDMPTCCLERGKGERSKRGEHQTYIQHPSQPRHVICVAQVVMFGETGLARKLF